MNSRRKEDIINTCEDVKATIKNEVYLITYEGKYLRTYNEWGHIETTEKVSEAQTFNEPSEENNLYFLDNEWIWNDEALLALGKNDFAMYCQIVKFIKQALQPQPISDLNYEKIEAPINLLLGKFVTMGDNEEIVVSQRQLMNIKSEFSKLEGKYDGMRSILLEEISSLKQKLSKIDGYINYNDFDEEIKKHGLIFCINKVLQGVD